MPVWVAIVISVGSMFGALSLVGKALMQFARLAARIETMFPVLAEIADQFRTDSGSSLKDQLNAMEKVGKENTEALNLLRAELARLPHPAVSAVSPPTIVPSTLQVSGQLLAVPADEGK